MVGCSRLLGSHMSVARQKRGNVHRQFRLEAKQGCISYNMRSQVSSLWLYLPREHSRAVRVRRGSSCSRYGSGSRVHDDGRGTRSGSGTRSFPERGDGRRTLGPEAEEQGIEALAISCRCCMDGIGKATAEDLPWMATAPWKKQGHEGVGSSKVDLGAGGSSKLAPWRSWTTGLDRPAGRQGTSRWQRSWVGRWA
ncbi:hypothetical protein TRIUR3_30885 [Triticum urartu]|uniref:Uncharacterized protein n=1 Tax=Triticum urartu TaxID=4572 RepID=M8A8E3_TRIUA|nr:hypothetical protein TRIUR3_30885 [Triticum urartu]